MSIKRVQKLLFSEYCDFEDMVLIESPFAQTTREGKGLRQVHLGLTPSKLVLATDILPPVETACVTFIPGIDPEIETFELIAIYPIDCVNLSVFRRRKRQTIKAHFSNNRVYYFELGGFENRTMFWNLWCEKVKFLSPEAGSSHTETSVATSSTASTLYLVDTRQVVKPNGLTQLWCRFGTGKTQPSEMAPKWTDRYLFLGRKFEDSSVKYKPVMNSPRIAQFVKRRKKSQLSVANKINHSLVSEINIGDYYQINRFGSGINEGCRSGLFLPAEDYIIPRRFSSSDQSSDSYELIKPWKESPGMTDMAEECIKTWEGPAGRQSSGRHRRRYGFAPHPLFLYGFGPWNVTTGAKYSIQVKRAVSLVSIRRQPHEPEMRLPVTKRQLVATISCQSLRNVKVIESQPGCGRRSIIFFWTPDYWYRPRSAKDAYLELHEHLIRINEYHKKNKKKRNLLRRKFCRKSNLRTSDTEDSSNSSTMRQSRKKNKKSLLPFGSLGMQLDLCDVDHEGSSKETTLQHLKRRLKIDTELTAWEFNSTTFAQQLTLIDKDLFLKISPAELCILVSQQSSRNAPNLAAMVAFSHRISCLVASDILKNDCERMRARLIARFITVAEKCHRISNFQSCRTVLFGLQSPAIYRLKSTWAYVRKKHGIKYQTFEALSRLYRDPRLLNYQKMFLVSSRNTPYMPFIGDILAKLLDRIPEYKLPGHLQNGVKNGELAKKDSGLFTKMLISLDLSSFQNSSLCASNSDVGRKGLCHYFKPLDCYEDNRRKCLIETTKFLQQCQLSALQYSFKPSKIATDYLLKARYKEEKDNFYQSFTLEPGEYTCTEDYSHEK